MPPRATPEGVTSSIARSARDDLQDTCGALIERIADRDETGLAALYDQTSALVFGLTVKILQDRRDAEESTLEVYQQVWRQADRYDPRRGTPLGWLMTIARSRAIDRLRASKRWTRGARPLDHEVSDHRDGPVEALMTSERRVKVRQAVSALKPEQRQALETAYFRGLSQSETALHLGLPLGTVKTRIRAAMMSLREQLRELELDP